MSNNIKDEAVFPPAVHSLKRMSNLSPSRNNAKGSYELYDPHHKPLDSPDIKRANRSLGSAPGSPGPVQDCNQVIEKLQRELEESKKKESDLQHMLADLKNPLSQTNTAYLENLYLEDSPSNDSIGENVKDAHIRHLQRQVTILQATLYKSEGWSNRVASALRERDKALDDVTRLTNGIRELQENNHQLMLKIDSLSTALQEAHQNLQVATEQLRDRSYNGQLVSQLKDEIQRQKGEITTLKESVSRLDLENRSLKDPSLETSTQSLGNMACSQELEHLHKVVDKLKSSVLEQRSYLLHLRQPSSVSNAKSLSTSSAFVKGDVVTDQDSIAGKNSSSQKHRGSTVNSQSIELTQGMLPQSVMFGHPNHTLVKPGTPKENFLEIQQNQHRISSNFVQDDVAGARRQLNSREMLEDTFNMDVIGSQNLLPTQGVGLLGMDYRHVPQMTNRNGYAYSNAVQTPHGYIGQQISGNTAKKNVGSTRSSAATGYDFGKSTQQSKETQSEAPSHRAGVEEVSKGKSGALGWQVRQWNLASANNSAAPVSASASEYMDSVAQSDLRLNPDQRQKHQPSRSAIQPQQETEGKMVETCLIPAGTQGQFVLNGNAAHVVLDPAKTQFGNFNLSSATSQSKHIYHSPSGYQDGSTQMSNYNMMGERKMTHAPPVHRPRTGTAQEVVYVNTSGDQELGTTNTSSSANSGPSYDRLNSDRFCPVCNNNYNHVSIEEFQTHIFDCIDSENSPETMKPNASPDRLCPMCNTSFDSTITQSEYEKHVHNHFREEGPGDNFEILQP